jgi:hypothetical protein
LSFGPGFAADLACCFLVESTIGSGTKPFDALGAIAIAIAAAVTPAAASQACGATSELAYQQQQGGRMSCKPKAAAQ